MDIKEIERVVASVQHAVFRNANTVAAGVLRSRFRGAGLQFREHQVYAPGDDVRFIDWKLSARSEHTYVKTFEEDRNVEITVCVDVTANSFYGSGRASKLQMAMEVCGLLYLLASQTHDLVRVLLFHQGRKLELPAKKGKEGLVQLISLFEREGLITAGRRAQAPKRSQRGDNGPELLKAIRQCLSRRKEVVYLGDMLDFPRTADARRLVHDARFHAVRLLSPVDTQKLPWSLPIGPGVSAGLGDPGKDDFLARFPAVTSDERYLEQFLRRIT